MPALLYEEFKDEGDAYDLKTARIKLGAHPEV
jgi:hypothetical protein